MSDQITNGKNGVPWKMFIWALSIIFLVFSISFATINSIVGANKEKTEQNSADIVDIKIFMSKADTTFINIDKTLNRLEQAINTKQK